jgi:hypothetical protein
MIAKEVRKPQTTAQNSHYGVGHGRLNFKKFGVTDEIADFRGFILGLPEAEGLG